MLWDRLYASGWAPILAADGALASPTGPCLSTLRVPFSLALFLAVLGAKAHWSPYWRYLLPIGFLGGYTTFSNFEYETLRTIQDGQIGLGLLYVGASVVVGFAAVWGGVIAGRAIP